MNEIQTLKERIAEKVGKELFELMPEEQWNSMVESQINHFMTELAPKIIRSELELKLKEDIKGKILALSLNDEWNTIAGKGFNNELSQILVSSAPQIIANIMHNSAQDVLSNMHQSIY
jgi:hypothetical protein